MQLPHNFANMFNRLKLHFSQNKMLLLAVILSLVLHMVLLTRLSLTLPVADDSQKALTMRLVKLQSAQKSAPTPTKEKTPRFKSAPLVEPEKTQIEPRIASSDDVNAFVNTSIAEGISTQNVEKITAMTAVDDAPEVAQEVSQEIAESDATDAIDSMSSTEPMDAAEQPHHQAYKYAETLFEVHRGSDTTVAGEARVVFMMQDNATYKLISTTEAKGLAALIFGKLQQVSEGTVTENGLRPSYFSYQYGANADKKQYADFAWSDGVIEMHSNKGNKIEKLTDGTQDLLSFMYQFMFVPPLESMQVRMTNGKNLRTYTYAFEGEKMIETKLGELKTVHLLKAGSEEEKTELWLALAYQYLPVKIRKTEKNGSVIEQTVVKLTLTN